MQADQWRNSIVALLGLLLCAIPAFAQEPQTQPAEAAAPPDPCPDTLTGDWAGLRTDLKKNGLNLCFNYTGEVLGNPAGGVRRGAIYEGRLELLLDLNLETAIGWSGATFHVNAYQIHGRGLSTNDLGNNLLTASNIEAERTTRLFDLWMQQEAWHGLVSVRVGQLAADDEFIISQYGSNFVNATFGWPGIASANLPSGGPVYPLSTPGVRVAISPTKALTFSAAVFNGDPAGPGSGTPQSRDVGGTAFRLNDGAFAIGEASYASDLGGGLTGKYKIGGWFHSGRFADQRFDGAGRSLADPASSGMPVVHRGDFGFYAALDQMILPKSQSPEDAGQGLGAFLRLAGAPSDRNLVALYADGGLSYTGLWSQAGDDVLGLGLAYAGISDAAAALDRDTRHFTGTTRPIRDFEMALELTYQWKLLKAWTIQPDLQFIFHPGGHVPDPGDPAHIRPVRDAVVVGVRTVVNF